MDFRCTDVYGLPLIPWNPIDSMELDRLHAIQWHGIGGNLDDQFGISTIPLFLYGMWHKARPAAEEVFC